MTFTIGGTFDSFDELQGRIKEFEVASNVQLTHRDSRTLTATKERVPKRVEKANQNLVYFSIDLTCLFGGKGCQEKGSGLRHHKR